MTRALNPFFAAQQLSPGAQRGITGAQAWAIACLCHRSYPSSHHISAGASQRPQGGALAGLPLPHVQCRAVHHNKLANRPLPCVEAIGQAGSLPGAGRVPRRARARARPPRRGREHQHTAARRQSKPHASWVDKACPVPSLPVFLAGQPASCGQVSGQSIPRAMACCDACLQRRRRRLPARPPAHPPTHPPRSRALAALRQTNRLMATRPTLDAWAHATHHAATTRETTARGVCKLHASPAADVASAGDARSCC